MNNHGPNLNDYQDEPVFPPLDRWVPSDHSEPREDFPHTPPPIRYLVLSALSWIIVILVILLSRNT